MKNHLPLLFSVAILAGLVAGCASGADPETSHVLAPSPRFTIDLPDGGDGSKGTTLYDPTFAYSVVGLSPAKTLQVLGRPTEQVTPDLWIYWQYYSGEQAAATGGHDSLVVEFSDGRVRGMKLVASDILRARLRDRQRTLDATRL